MCHFVRFVSLSCSGNGQPIWLLDKNISPMDFEKNNIFLQSRNLCFGDLGSPPKECMFDCLKS